MNDAAQPATAPTLERHLGVFSATTLIVGSMIGSGIFIAPSIMASHVAGPGVYLALWGGAGVLTLLGALCYGELAAMLPRAGGQYVFLREAFGPMVAFLYGCSVFLVVQTGFNAAVSIAFAKYLGLLGLPIGEQHVILSIGRFHLSSAQLVAAAVIVLLTAINARGVKEGAFVQNIFTVLKVGAIVLLVLVGFGVGLATGRGSFAHFLPLASTALGPRAEAVGAGFLAAAGVAMSKALFAYDAWNTVTFAAEEIRDPAKNLPRALLWGTVLTTLAYVGAASVYLFIVPLARMAAVPENRIAAEVAGIVLGQPGIVLVSLAILVSTFGCTNGLILGGGRVLYAMARDGVFFRSCAKVHDRWHTPTAALGLQALWSIVLAFSGSYDALLTYVTFASLSFNALTVAGLLVLRRRRKDAPRPYRVVGYPATPIAYLLGAGFFVTYIFIGAPKESLIGLGLVALGVPAYWFFRRGSAPAT